MIAKIDCVSHPHVCNVQEHIRAYPTLRLFVDGERWKGGDYRGHRTVLEMVEWLLWVEEQHKTNMDDDEKTIQIAHEGTHKPIYDACCGTKPSFDRLSNLVFFSLSRPQTPTRRRRIGRGKTLGRSNGPTKKPEAQYMERFGTSWMPTYRSFDGR